MKLDEFTLTSIISACVVLVALTQGRQVHASIMKSGFGSHVVLGSSLVDMYAKCRGLEEAHLVFDEIPRRNEISWTTMITGYAQQCKVTEALSFLYQMQQEGIELNEFTLTTILGVFASLSIPLPSMESQFPLETKQQQNPMKGGMFS